MFLDIAQNNGAWPRPPSPGAAAPACAFRIQGERRWNNLKDLKSFYLEAEARIWPWLSCTRQIAAVERIWHIQDSQVAHGLSRLLQMRLCEQAREVRAQQVIRRAGCLKGQQVIITCSTGYEGSCPTGHPSRLPFETACGVRAQAFQQVSSLSVFGIRPLCMFGFRTLCIPARISKRRHHGHVRTPPQLKAFSRCACACSRVSGSGLSTGVEPLRR